MAEKMQRETQEKIEKQNRQKAQQFNEWLLENEKRKGKMIAERLIQARNQGVTLCFKCYGNRKKQ